MTDPATKFEYFDCARRVLLAGVWLIENGWGKLALLPYVYATGHWRCEFHLPAKPSQVVFRYSIANGYDFMASAGGTPTSASTDIEALAKIILRHVPDHHRSLCAGAVDRPLAEWLKQLKQVLGEGRLPEAFCEYYNDPSHWRLSSIFDGAYSVRPMPAMPGYFYPGTEPTPMDETYWKSAEKRTRRLAKRPSISVPSRLFEDTSACHSLAVRIRRDLEGIDSFVAAKMTRAIVGAWHLEAGKLPVVEDGVPGAARVSVEASKDVIVRRATRLLSMVQELHKLGYQGLRIAPGWNPTRSEWRCALLPSYCTADDGWTPVSLDWRVDYSSTDGKNYFGWTDAGSDDARRLANKFIERQHPFLSRCRQTDWSYVGWFAGVLASAERGELPAFYGLGAQTSEHEQVLPPMSMTLSVDSAEWSGTGQPLIPNDELSVGSVPAQDSPREQLERFCLSFDGYAGGLVSIDECFAVADKVMREPLETSSMTELRTSAFIYQRKLRSDSESEVISDGHDTWRCIVMLVDEIRRRLQLSGSLATSSG